MNCYLDKYKTCDSSYEKNDLDAKSKYTIENGSKLIKFEGT